VTGREKKIRTSGKEGGAQKGRGVGSRGKRAESKREKKGQEGKRKRRNRGGEGLFGEKRATEGRRDTALARLHKEGRGASNDWKRIGKTRKKSIPLTQRGIHNKRWKPEIKEGE